MAGLAHTDVLTGLANRRSFTERLRQEQAQAVAQRVHAALAEQPLPGIEPPHRLSVSMGLTLFDPLRPLDVTLRLLDSALYTAKREGRSRTVVV